MSSQKRSLPPSFDAPEGVGHDGARKRRETVRSHNNSHSNSNSSSNMMYSPSLFYGSPDARQPPYFGSAAAMGVATKAGPSMMASSGPQMASSGPQNALHYPPSALRHGQHAVQRSAAPQPLSAGYAAAQASSNARMGLAAIRIAGHSVRDLAPNFQATAIPADELARRHAAVVHELRYQKENPPVLPPSKVADLPPKQDIPDFLSLPEDLDEETRVSIQDHNNRVSAISQRIDRERNNMAAKKSRALRIESRDMYRQLYIEATAKLFHHRFVAALEGRDSCIWERLPERYRSDLVELAQRGAEQVENKIVEAKKQDEARKRRERARARSERRALQDDGGSQHGAALPHIGTAENDVLEHLQVVSPRL